MADRLEILARTELCCETITSPTARFQPGNHKGAAPSRLRRFAVLQGQASLVRLEHRRPRLLAHRFGTTSGHLGSGNFDGFSCKPLVFFRICFASRCSGGKSVCANR
jgi:hypothetical protein